MTTMVACFVGSIYLCVLAFADPPDHHSLITTLGLEITPLNHDFGEVDQNQYLTTRITLTNHTTTQIHIADVMKSCGCTTSELSTTALAPGASATLDLTWNTRSLRGPSSEAIAIVYANEHETTMQTTTINVRANVRPFVTSSVARFEFDHHTRSTQMVVLARADGRALTITSATSCQEAFTVTHDRNVLQVDFDPTRFRPERGVMAITLTTDCPEEPTIRLPIVLKK